MSAVQIDDYARLDDYARRLYAARGDRAEYEAAQKARACAAKGALREAGQWQRVRAAIRQQRGPNAS